ncbi:hypothetical protein QAD02_016185 [Eretmocerus hayati]|uniref:Uncharacterized protein n=1 Tax=Eretmocerus hayati TaxID=131215 RepID=A0ACC2PBB5_9HYME|nr:hypothetical protein QAD02_016185 [Eretmocerus hayati]
MNGPKMSRRLPDDFSHNIQEIDNEFLQEVLKYRANDVEVLHECNTSMASDEETWSPRPEHIVARNKHGRSCLHTALLKMRNYYDFAESLECISYPQKANIVGWPSLLGLEEILSKLSDPWITWDLPIINVPDISVNIELVKQLIEAGADVNAIDCEGNSCLHYAVENEKCREVVPVLLNAGAELDLMNKHQDSPLSIAVKVNNFEAVEILIQHGADIKTCNSAGNTCLHLAGDDATFCLLLNAGCTSSLNQISKCGCSPLLSAVEFCEVETLIRIIQGGADINFTHQDDPWYACHRHNRTPLGVAVSEKRDVIVEVLLQHGANPNKIEKFPSGFDEMSILLKAVLYCEENILKLLITYGADICNDVEPFKAVMRNRDLREINVFLDEFRRRKVRMPTRDPPLHLSLENQRDEVFTFILESNLNDLDEKNGDGFTALHTAIAKQKIERARVLLDYGADVNTVDNSGKSILSAAIANIDFECVILLLSHGSISNWRVEMTNHDSRFFRALHRYPDFNPSVDQFKIEGILLHLALFESDGRFIASGELGRTLRWYPESLKQFYTRCKAEIEVSQMTILHNSITMYDILTKVDYRYARNECLVEKLGEEDLYKQFPIYEGVIRHRYAESHKVLDQMSKGVEGLGRILKIDYLNFHQIYENILCRLRTIDLITLQKI